MTQTFDKLLETVIENGRIKENANWIQVGLEEYGSTENQDTVLGFRHYNTKWGEPYKTVVRPLGVLGCIRGDLIIYMVSLDAKCQDGNFDILVGRIPTRRKHPFPPSIFYAGKHSIGPAWKYRNHILRKHLTKDFCHEEQIMLEAMIGKS